MNKSDSIKNIAEALHKCQGEIGGVVKNSANPFFKSSYADLTAILKEIKPIWHKHDITVIQHPHSLGNSAGVTSLIMHSSGEWIEHEFTLPLAKQDPQAAGSAITYARRYALAAIGLIPQLDDDGESAMLRPPKEDEYGRPILSDKEHQKMVSRLADSVMAIKSGIEKDDQLKVYESYVELTQDEQIFLFKGTEFFSSKEKNYIRNCKSVGESR